MTTKVVLDKKDGMSNFLLAQHTKLLDRLSMCQFKIKNSTDPSAEDIPSPLVHEVTERYKSKFVKCHAHQVVDVALCVVVRLSN